MTQEDKILLLKDLCTRVPYHPKGHVVNTCNGAECDEWLTCVTFTMFTNVTNNCRLYLRPMSSMIEEEVKEIQKINWQFCKPKNGECYVGAADDGYCSVSQMKDVLEYLNAHHFDYRDLIEKGLALEAPEGMYQIE